MIQMSKRYTMPSKNIEGLLMPNAYALALAQLQASGISPIQESCFLKQKRFQVEAVRGR